MATPLNSEIDLLSVPFSAATDFTDLADYCDRFAESLIECHETTYEQALLGRLSACLALLRPTLGEPIPAHLLKLFNVPEMPEPKPHFEPDAEALCDYCQALTQVLSQQSLSPETETSLKGLLCELVWMFAADLKAPRWVTVALPHSS